MISSRNSTAGFSLIELLVASTIFSIIVVGVSGLFIQALSLQRQVNGIQKIESSVLLIVESLTREVRVSTVTSANTPSCVPGVATSTLSITHPVNGAVTYAYDSAAGTVSRNGQQMNADGVNFKIFAFCVSGAGAEGNQVRVTMPMVVESRKSRDTTTTSISLQTTIVSRDLSTDPIP